MVTLEAGTRYTNSTEGNFLVATVDEMVEVVGIVEGYVICQKGDGTKIYVEDCEVVIEVN
jgi:hypothetical protein